MIIAKMRTADRWRTRLPLNVCHDRLRRLMPTLSRYALYQCLNHWGLSRIGATEPAPFLTSAALRGPYCFEITADQIVFPYEALSAVVRVFLAVTLPAESIAQDLGDGQKQVNRVWDFVGIGCLGDSCLRDQRLYRGNDR